ncbi:kinase-like domain [Pyrenophora seminiperda CCB06]|uniref:Kinase-like domain n=1 Tax=Pyrenophora seminiperda CCB06 TaxID=1302712 RepID=A0A3M7MIY4_9PLEO|nr:kinase-like domain [Pyrenophora seminiperda CCB06]
MPANIRTKRDLLNLCEVEDISTGAFIRTTFTYVDDLDRAWFGETNEMRKYDLTVEDLNRLLQPVPNEKIYPRKPDTVPVVSGANREKLYIKRPKLLYLDDEQDTKLLPRILLEEAEVLQFFAQHPHPNLVRFHGCTVNRDWMTGIALEKHDIVLQYRHEDVPYPLDIKAFMHKLREGTRHIHSLGFAHNDLNPTNILLDRNDNPIIIDFGSCKRFGENLLSGGTPGWIDEDFSTSAQCHDESALEKIERWLQSTIVRDA